MTPDPHTKFEHNLPSRSWDTEARCARAHVQRYPNRDHCVDTATNACTTTKWDSIAYQISTRSAQPLSSSSRRNICDTPKAARATCPNRHWHDSALVPYTAGGDGVTNQRRPLINWAYGARDISLSKAWPWPAGRWNFGPPMSIRSKQRTVHICRSLCPSWLTSSAQALLWNQGRYWLTGYRMYLWGSILCACLPLFKNVFLICWSIWSDFLKMLLHLFTVPYPSFLFQLPLHVLAPDFLILLTLVW